jgi:hypothetical protein
VDANNSHTRYKNHLSVHVAMQNHGKHILFLSNINLALPSQQTYRYARVFYYNIHFSHSFGNKYYAAKDPPKGPHGIIPTFLTVMI